MKAILKSVSRSFYLTIRFLPRPLREPVSLAYLLARATDTIADTATIPAAIRLTTLRDFARVIAGELDFNAVAAAVAGFRGATERSARADVDREPARVHRLARPSWTRRTATIFAACSRPSSRGRSWTSSVLAIRRPLPRYEPGRNWKNTPTSWPVAWAISGRNWGFDISRTFASRSPDEMTKLGIDYGKGLQLINVLRDRGGRRRGGSRLFAGRGIGDCAGRGSFRKLARQGGRENHRRDRLLLQP